MKKYKHVAYISLFENEPDGNKPAMSGTVEYPDGTKMSVSLWNKTSSGGREYLNGAIQSLEEDAPIDSKPSGSSVGAPSYIKQAPSVAKDVKNTNSSSSGSILIGDEDDLPF
jgi:hypothetical protein